MFGQKLALFAFLGTVRAAFLSHAKGHLSPLAQGQSLAAVMACTETYPVQSPAGMSCDAIQAATGVTVATLQVLNPGLNCAASVPYLTYLCLAHPDAAPAEPIEPEFGVTGVTTSAESTESTHASQSVSETAHISGTTVASSSVIEASSSTSTADATIPTPEIPTTTESVTPPHPGTSESVAPPAPTTESLAPPAPTTTESVAPPPPTTTESVAPPAPTTTESVAPPPPTTTESVAPPLPATTAWVPPPTTAWVPPPTTAWVPPPTTAWVPPPTTAWVPPPTTAWVPPPTTAWVPQPTTAWIPPPTTAWVPPPPPVPTTTSSIPPVVAPPPPIVTAGPGGEFPGGHPDIPFNTGASPGSGAEFVVSWHWFEDFSGDCDASITPLQYNTGFYAGSEHIPRDCGKMGTFHYKGNSVTVQFIWRTTGGSLYHELSPQAFAQLIGSGAQVQEGMVSTDFQIAINDPGRVVATCSGDYC
ncbi:hypothetical protein HDU98_012058 [Podochytrium sp. JEL0797]|nr:hypothetical protein HDU98_012058 [Podochytrium sp. JEL0797]